MRVSLDFRLIATLVLVLFASSATLPAQDVSVDSQARARGLLRVEVAENGFMFIPDTEPVIPGTENDPFPLPAYGGEFITGGYLYPEGTLTCGPVEGGLGCNGVNDDGTPEFPDLVIGTWTCRGWHVGDGALTETGAWTATNQIYSFTTEIANELGARTITTDGFESPEPKSVRRVISGGTGRYVSVQGEQLQKFLGWNPSIGIGLSVEFRFKDRWD